MGKLIGAVIGYFSLGFVGVILGLIAGFFFDKGLRQMQRQLNPEERLRIQQAFFSALFPIMGHIAKADGRVSEEEVSSTEALMTKMGLNDSQRQEAITLFKSGAVEGFSLTDTLNTFTEVCGGQRDLNQIFLVYLITLAYADGQLHDAEEEILSETAQKLGYSGFAFNHLLGMMKAQTHFYRGQNSDSGYHQRDGGRYSDNTSGNELTLAYEALGVEASISDADLKKAYRKLMSEFHPDKLAGRGVPEDMVKLATERSQEIQAAYDLVKQSRKASS